MGSSSSRDHEVHVVVVQSQEGGKMDAKVIRGRFPKAMKNESTSEDAKNSELNKLDTAMAKSNYKLRRYISEQVAH